MTGKHWKDFTSSRWLRFGLCQNAAHPSPAAAGGCAVCVGSMMAVGCVAWLLGALAGFICITNTDAVNPQI